MDCPTHDWHARTMACPECQALQLRASMLRVLIPVAVIVLALITGTLIAASVMH